MEQLPKSADVSHRGRNTAQQLRSYANPPLSQTNRYQIATSLIQDVPVVINRNVYSNTGVDIADS